jgi:hypothetical protein
MNRWIINRLPAALAYPQTTLPLVSGKDFTIEARNLSPGNSDLANGEGASVREFHIKSCAWSVGSL